ncbi:MAG TPA: GNAT family N-acetyltransferase [Hanamia sp.]|nr:GNAT family N-acetyltransferase [Hanamia sp.]
MDLSIRKIELKDASLVAGLTFQLGYQATEEEIKKRLREILSDEKHCAFAALDHDKVVGWIHGFYSTNLESGPFVEIGGMVVDESYRKKGIARKLVEMVEGWSIQNGYNRLRVRSNVKRKAAHEFYKKIGFNETKEQKVFDKKIK